jgi:acyl-CoA synthetase (NDP forming)
MKRAVASDDIVGRLRGLFTPSSVVLVGATDNSQWSVFTHANLRRYSPDVTVHLVHPNHEKVHGERAHNSVSAIGESVDLAYVMVPTSAVIDVVEEIADVGTRNLVILTAGFQEAGPAGTALAARLEKVAHDRDLTVLGPNGNGFINIVGGVAAYGLPIAPPLVRGPVGIVLQSGGLAASVLSGAQVRGVGLSLMVSTGNEALVSATDIMRYLIEDEATKVVAAFLESIRQPEDFQDVAERALHAGKPIVALKAGRSEQGARTALAHTGALAGDDRMVDAAFRQLGVVRVNSLEELLATAGYLGYHPDVRGRRIAAVTPSGGACDLLADRAWSEGLELPEFPAATLAALTELLPPFSNPHNPLDVTGYVVVDPRLSFEAMQIVAKEAAGNYDMILYATSLPRIAPKDLKPIVNRLDALAAARQRIPVPLLLQTSLVSDLPPYVLELFEQRDLYVLNGIELGTRAIGHGARYHERRSRYLAAASRASISSARLLQAPPGAEGVWTEHRARALLEAHGIRLAPVALAKSAAEAAELAACYAQPVAMKVASDQVAHKSDVGGVRLEVEPAQAATVFSELVATLAEHRPESLLAGVLIGPMRRGGTELLVGVVTDPDWGKVLSVGLGGLWVEVLDDVSLRLLPVDELDVAEMLTELRSAALLTGVRGSTAADIDHLCQVIARIADLAEGLGSALDTLEVNPLRVEGSDVEVLDALVVWKGGQS